MYRRSSRPPSLVCSHCGTTNAPNCLFCTTCGALRLVLTPASRRRAPLEAERPLEPPAHHEEREQVQPHEVAPRWWKALGSWVARAVGARDAATSR